MSTRHLPSYQSSSKGFSLSLLTEKNHVSPVRTASFSFSLHFPSYLVNILRSHRDHLIQLGENRVKIFELGHFLRQWSSMQIGRSAPWKSVAVRDSTAGHRAERRSLRGSSEGRPGILSLLSSCGLAHDVALSRIFPVRYGFSFFFSSPSVLSFLFSKRVNWIGFDFLPV